jgi:hypothetical protein
MPLPDTNTFATVLLWATLWGTAGVIFTATLWRHFHGHR